MKSAAQLVIDSFVNLSAVRRAALRWGEAPVLLVCSGTKGERSDEDELFAGVVALQLLQVLGGAGPGDPVRGDVGDEATLEVLKRVAEIFEQPLEVSVAGSAAAPTPTPAGGGRGPAACAAALEKTIRESTNGQMLARLGLVEDFEVILDVDRFDSTLPTYNSATDCFTQP